MSGKGKGGRGEKKSTTSSAKAGLQFPVGRIGRYFFQAKGNSGENASASVFRNANTTMGNMIQSGKPR